MMSRINFKTFCALLIIRISFVGIKYMPCVYKNMSEKDWWDEEKKFVWHQKIQNIGNRGRWSKKYIELFHIVYTMLELNK